LHEQLPKEKLAGRGWRRTFSSMRLQRRGCRQCLVDGAWIGEGVDGIRHPANGALILTVPRYGFDEAV